MQVVIVEPEKKPFVQNIDDTLTSMQQIVGGKAHVQQLVNRAWFVAVVGGNAFQRIQIFLLGSVLLRDGFSLHGIQ